MTLPQMATRQALLSIKKRVKSTCRKTITTKDRLLADMLNVLRVVPIPLFLDLVRAARPSSSRTGLNLVRVVSPISVDDFFRSLGVCLSVLPFRCVSFLAVGLFKSG